MLKSKIQSYYKIVANKSFMEYAEDLWNGHEFDDLFNEMYHTGGYDEKRMIKYINDIAKRNNINLIDRNEIDEDSLYEMYNESEKGLS